MKTNAEADLSSGLIFDIRRFSIHDGPGIRTTIFFKGCPLSCWWCHNPEGISVSAEAYFRPERCLRCGACVDVCPQNAVTMGERFPITSAEKCTLCGECLEDCYADARQIVGKKMRSDEVLKEILRDRPFYDESGGGVTFSGGEPLLQPDFLLELLQACKFEEIHTTLDTSGFSPSEVMERIRSWVDLFLFDVKMVEEERHRRFTGVSNGIILENLRGLSSSGQRIVLRIPLIPGINDDEKNLRQIGILAAELDSLEGVVILPYHQLGADKYSRLGRRYQLSEIKDLSGSQIEEAQNWLREYVPRVEIGGQKKTYGND
jgi:pyruvate formate lyase activating enzyme